MRVRIRVNHYKNSDLCLTPIYEQFDTSDITAVIRREERDGFCHFVRTAHSPQWYGAQEGCLQLLALYLSLYHATGHRCVYRARTDSIDADLAMFQIYGPCTHKKSYSSLGCAVNTGPLEPVRSGN